MWPEGPYDENDASVQAMYPLDRGVNALVKSLRDNNIGPNGTQLDPSTKEVIAGTEGTTNVYSELGGVWPNLITGRHTEAMHVIGKLLKHIGEDRIVWGTDCLWFGSPQPIIEAFRCFSISDDFQQMYGYPQLTQTAKEKILGQNAAKLNEVRGITGVYGKCHADVVGQQAMRQLRDLDGEFGARRDMMTRVFAPKTRREFLRLHEREEQEKRQWSGNLAAYPSSPTSLTPSNRRG
jgi:hypothetical protein